MRIIEIASLPNGAHNDQTIDGDIKLHEGWAVAPVDTGALQNYPFGNFEVEYVDGVPHMIADSWEPLPLPETVVDVQAQIAELKAELNSTDYKIIKCSEAQMVGEELPYDIAALHAERQALRDKINELEGGDS